MVAEVAYVQNDGKDLLQFEEMNQPIYVAGQTTAANKDLFRPYPGFSSVLRSTNWGARTTRASRRASSAGSRTASASAAPTRCRIRTTSRRASIPARRAALLAEAAGR